MDNPEKYVKHISLSAQQEYSQAEVDYEYKYRPNDLLYDAVTRAMVIAFQNGTCAPEADYSKLSDQWKYSAFVKGLFVVLSSVMVVYTIPYLQNPEGLCDKLWLMSILVPSSFFAAMSGCDDLHLSKVSTFIAQRGVGNRRSDTNS